MPKITKDINLDVAKKNSFQAIVAKQNDSNSRELRVTITNEGTKVNVKIGSAVIINVERADGETRAIPDGEVNADGTVTVPLTPWMLKFDGIIRCDISIVEAGSKKLTTTSFSIDVEAASCSKEPISQEDENYGLLIRLIDKVSETKAACEAATSSAYAAVSTINQKTIRRYGVRMAVNQSSPTLERIWDSVGLKAAAGVDGNIVTNSFDSIYPWSHMRECNIEVVNGKLQVKAYKGEPTFTTDGSNGDVAIEIPKFYQAPPFIGDGYEYWGVCDLPLGGWMINPSFIGRNGQILDKIYVAKYTSGLVDGALVSRSGVTPAVYRTRTKFRSLAQQKDGCCQLIDLAYQNVLTTLFTVEFSTLHSQSIMYGASNLPNNATHRPVIAETGTNRVILPDAQASQYVEGQYIDIGTTQGDAYGGGQEIAKSRRIVSITAYDGANKAILFNGGPINTATNQILSWAIWPSGATDGVTAASGSLLSNVSDQYPCKYRGIENPWGNTYEFIDGVIIHKSVPWICDNPAYYADKIPAEQYKELNYSCPVGATSSIGKMGFDERYPWARLAEAFGGSSTTRYCDMHQGESLTNSIAAVSGGRNSTSRAGIWYLYSYNGENVALTSLASRLLWKP